MRFIPSLKDIVFPKQEMLKDEYDEWLARIICFAFSLPPTAFIKQNNRATGEQAAETAKEEGLMPLMRWIANKMNFLITRHLQVKGLKFKWKMENVLDPTAQSAVDVAYVGAQIKTPAEVRETLGLDPMTPAEKEAAWPTPPELPATEGKPGAPDAKPAPVEKYDGRPQVIEFRPEIFVEIGDTVIQNTRERAA